MIIYIPYESTSHRGAVERLGEETFDSEYSQFFRIALRDAKSNLSIIALCGRKMVGVALCAPARFFRHLDVTELAYLMVHPDFRGQGIGSTLLDKVKMMSPAVVLEVSHSNPDAERLYKKHGFIHWRNLYTKANGGYLMGWSRQRHERMLRLRSREHLPGDGIVAPST
jgi:ribosomal protein S18 acetylase RimI-like enzyme